MLRIECPYCGIRDQTEFRFGGEANVNRPARPEHADDAEWADYLFYRDNLKGTHAERWLHSYGCRRWFTVLRDTVTHEVRSAGERAPDRDTDRDTDRDNGRDSA